jgi:hypothetical protein
MASLSWVAGAAMAVMLGTAVPTADARKLLGARQPPVENSGYKVMPPSTKMLAPVM